MSAQVHIDGEVYPYRVGRDYVSIDNPNGPSVHVACAEIKGLTRDEWDRGRRKRSENGSVFPSEVKNWILNAKKDGRL